MKFLTITKKKQSNVEPIGYKKNHTFFNTEFIYQS